jgi:hypothetical protein
MDARRLADRIVLAVAELPGRSSPEDQPEMMLVSDTELREIIISAIEEAPEEPKPIGKCKCGAPIYTKEGFCGVCEPWKR